MPGRYTPQHIFYTLRNGYERKYLDPTKTNTEMKEIQPSGILLCGTVEVDRLSEVTSSFIIRVISLVKVN
jgi:hypothetical protein